MQPDGKRVDVHVSEDKPCRSQNHYLITSATLSVVIVSQVRKKVFQPIKKPHSSNNQTEFLFQLSAVGKAVNRLMKVLVALHANFGDNLIIGDVKAETIIKETLYVNDKVDLPKYSNKLTVNCVIKKQRC